MTTNKLNTHEYLSSMLHKFGVLDCSLTFGKASTLNHKIPRRGFAEYVVGVLGEYTYSTVTNSAPVTVATAIKKGYYYTQGGKLTQMTPEAVIEFMMIVYPEIELHDDKLVEKRREILESDDIYPFFKIEVVEMNVHRRMKKHGIIPYLSQNVRHFSKRKMSHLHGEEEKTRKMIYNTFLLLRRLAENNEFPIMVQLPEYQEEEPYIQLST